MRNCRSCTISTRTPAGAASRLTARPLRALGLSAAIAVCSVWIGLLASYTIPRMPPSFAILAVATLIYLLAIAATRSRRERNGIVAQSVSRTPG